MYNEATRCYQVVAESQSADVTVNRTIPRGWPSIETTRINVTCLLVYRAYILKFPGSAYLRMFFTTIEAMVSEAFKGTGPG